MFSYAQYRSNITHQNDYLIQTDMGLNEMEPIVLLVKYEMGPNVQSGKTRRDQKSSLAKMAWDQKSMGPILWLPGLSFVFPRSDYHLTI